MSKNKIIPILNESGDLENWSVNGTLLWYPDQECTNVVSTTLIGYPGECIANESRTVVCIDDIVFCTDPSDLRAILETLDRNLATSSDYFEVERFYDYVIKPMSELREIYPNANIELDLEMQDVITEYYDSQ